MALHNNLQLIPTHISRKNNKIKNNKNNVNNNNNQNLNIQKNKGIVEDKHNEYTYTNKLPLPLSSHI